MSEPGEDFRVPVELRVGNVTGYLGELSAPQDPQMQRLRLAEFLRAVADEFEHPTGEG